MLLLTSCNSRAVEVLDTKRVQTSDESGMTRIASRGACCVTVVAVLWLSVATVVAGPVSSVVQGCPGSQGNEWCATAQVTVVPGDYVNTATPSCDKNVAATWEGLVFSYEHSRFPNVSQYAGALTADSPVLMQSENANALWGLSALGPSRLANCAVLALAVPQGSTVRKLKREAREQFDVGWHECGTDQDCPIGWSGFEPEVLQAATTTGTVVGGVFKNWSHNRQREARLTVYFDPPSASWSPSGITLAANDNRPTSDLWWNHEPWNRACPRSRTGITPILGGSNYDLLKVELNGDVIFADYVFDGKNLTCANVGSGGFVVALVHGDESKRDVSTMYGIRSTSDGRPSATVVLNYQRLLDGRIAIVSVTDDTVTLRFGQHAPWRFQRFCWQEQNGVWTKSEAVLSPDVPACARNLEPSETRPLLVP
jgi:hypothetical protein